MREQVNWERKPKSLAVSTSFNGVRLSLRGKVYRRLIRAQDLEKFRTILKENDVFARLGVDAKAKREGRCKNTHYESARVGFKLLGGEAKEARRYK